MSRVFVFLILLHPFSSIAQSFDYSIGQQMEKIDSVSEWLVEYEQLGYKSVGSSELNKARDWIMAKYASFGYEAQLDSFKYSSLDLQNIIVEKAGLQPGKWIILSAHYDSYNNSPGANDNGSGVVACMQIAKIMKDIDCEIGVRIVHFSAEESGLVGSTHYVANSLDKGDELQLVLNLDQLGGSKAADNSKITCERDEHMNPSSNNTQSALVTDTLAQLTRNYSFLEPVIAQAYSSDYIPFQDSGYIITGLYQESNYPFYHSENDVVANMDVNATEQVIRVALAASMYFARNTLSLGTEEFPTQALGIYPNPAKNEVHLPQHFLHSSYRLFNSQGQVVGIGELSQSTVLSLNGLSNGFYRLEVMEKQQALIHYTKLIIAR